MLRVKFTRAILVAAILFCVCEIIESARRGSGAGDYAIKVFPNVAHTLIISRPQNAGWDFPRVASDYLDATAEWSAARVNASTRRKAASTE